MNGVGILKCLMIILFIVFAGCDKKDAAETKRDKKDEAEVKRYTLISSATQEGVAKLQKLTNAYAEHSIASDSQTFQIDSLTIEVIAEISSFPTTWVGNGTAGVKNVTLTPDQAAEAIKQFKDAIHSHVATALQVDKTAAFRLLIVIKEDADYGWSVIPSIGMGRITGDVFLIGTKDNIVLFHSEIGRNGQNINQALLALAEHVQEELMKHLKLSN